ncbi:MAG: adenylate/guanylate cyclase domain-containing protein [Candidatus Berkiella sp.]
MIRGSQGASIQPAIKRSHSTDALADFELREDFLKLLASAKKIGLPLLKNNDQTATPNDIPVTGTQVFQSEKVYKNAIFLFADMQGYTERSKQLSPLDIIKLLNPIYDKFYEFAQKEKRFGVEVIKLTGDCIMLSACNANTKASTVEQAKAMLRVALCVSHSLMELNDKSDTAPIYFRFGLHVGKAARVKCTLPSGQVTIDWLGHDVNLAARLETSSLPNQIQMSEQFHNLVKGSCQSAPCTHEVKDFSQLHTYFAETSPRKSAKYTPLNDSLSASKTRRGSFSTPDLHALDEFRDITSDSPTTSILAL